jgi:small subunit ribosomal protein S5
MSKKPHSRNHQKEVKEFDEEVLQIDRVTRVVKGGRRLRFRATVIIGNRKGKVGVGVGKSEEVVGAIQKAVADAKKNLATIIVDKTTIPHATKVKYKSARIILIPASEGTGIIAGGPVRKVVELAGIRNILSKSLGTTNKISCARATLLALAGMERTPFTGKAEFPEIKEVKRDRQDRPPRKKFQRRDNNNTNKPAEAPKAEVKPEVKKEEAPKAVPQEAPKTETPAEAPKESNN